MPEPPLGSSNLNPIGYIANLAAVSHYYGSDLLALAAVSDRALDRPGAPATGWQQTSGDSPDDAVPLRKWLAAPSE